jgi:DNA-binding MarR family transcriptional regulator
MNREEEFKLVEQEFTSFMENLNTNMRINQSYHSTPRYYGIEEELYISEAHVIQAIGDCPEQGLIELADRTHRTKSAMSMMIRKLSKKGLVSKIRTEADNRKVALTLTEKGKIVYDYHQKLDAVNYRSIYKRMCQSEDISLENLRIANRVLMSLIEIPCKGELLPVEEEGTNP